MAPPCLQRRRGDLPWKCYMRKTLNFVADAKRKINLHSDEWHRKKRLM